MEYLAFENGLGLIPFTKQDMPEWLACWRDEGTQRGFNFVPPEDGKWAVAQDIARFPFWVTVVDCQNGAHLGSLRLSPDIAHPDLAIWIYPAHRGKGVGSTAFRMALTYLFCHGYSVIYAGCFPENHHSRRILEKCGFVRWPEGDAMEASSFEAGTVVMEGYACTR